MQILGLNTNQEQTNSKRVIRELLQFAKLIKVRQSRGKVNNFVRGIDTCSNKPFLLFVLTSNIFSSNMPDQDCYQLEIGVAVIFEKTGIEHVINVPFVLPHDGPMNYTLECNFNVQDIAHFMKHGVLFNDFAHQRITEWIHLRDKPSQHESSKLKRKIRNIALYALLVVCVSSGLLVLMCERCYI